MPSISKAECHGLCCSFFTVASVLLMIVLLSVTVNRSVDQSDYGILYDHFNMKFDNNVKEQGKYTTGVGVDIYLFQRTVRTFPLSVVQCYSNDKVTMSLEVTVQTQYREQSLISVIMKQFSNAKNYDNFLSLIIKSTILATCLQFQSEDFYLIRSTIDSAMFNNLQAAINTKDYGSDVQFFQLSKIDLPVTLANIITQKQNVDQQLVTAKNDRQNHLTQAVTRQLQAEQTIRVTNIQANNTASVIINKANVNKAIVQTQWNSRAQAYKAIVSGFSLNAQSFADYLHAELIRLVGKVVVQ